MKKTFILFLILASLFALSGCEYYTEEAVSRAWEEGYEEGEITYDPQTVRIKGEAAVLNTVNKITIPAEVLDLTGAKADIEKTVDISTYLPFGTALVLSADSKINVVVEVEAVKSKTLQIPVANIQTVGLDTDEHITYEDDVLIVNVTGRTSVVDALDEKTITASIDVSGLRMGAHSLQATVELDSDLLKFENPTISFTIEKKSETQDTSDN